MRTVLDYCAYVWRPSLGRMVTLCNESSGGLVNQYVGVSRDQGHQLSVYHILKYHFGVEPEYWIQLHLAGGQGTH